MMLMLNLLLLILLMQILVPLPTFEIDFIVDSVVVLALAVAGGIRFVGWMVWLLVISCIYFVCPVISL
jgi:hypothetical protein